MRRAMLISILTLLALPSLAAGKGLRSGQACGPSACTTTAFHDRFPKGFVLPPVLSSGTYSSQRPHAAPWFRVRFSLPGMEGGGALTGVVLADESYVAGRDQNTGPLVWQPTSADEAAFYRRLTRGVQQPYPAASLPGVGGSAAVPASAGSPTPPASSSASAPPLDSDDAGGWSPWNVLTPTAAAALLGGLVVLGRRRRAHGPTP